VAKGGTSNLQAVYEYAEPVTAKGFVYMDTPGYDPVSATGQVAGGANLICFTTGRGSAYGCAPSPSLKFSTNTALWKKQEEDMDLNCGEIVDGGVSIAEMGQRIFEMILAAASGEPTKSERHGYGQNEFGDVNPLTRIADPTTSRTGCAPTKIHPRPVGAHPVGDGRGTRPKKSSRTGCAPTITNTLPVGAHPVGDWAWHTPQKPSRTEVRSYKLNLLKAPS
jgi:hypothetical protein